MWTDIRCLVPFGVSITSCSVAPVIGSDRMQKTNRGGGGIIRQNRGTSYKSSWCRTKLIVSKIFSGGTTESGVPGCRLEAGDTTEVPFY